jgi:predicted secreted protein
MTDAAIGYGAEFWLENESSVLTQLAEITSVTPPNSQTADVEATHMLSPNRRREYIAGLIDDGEGTFEMNLVPGSTTDTLIRTAQTAGDNRQYRIVIPDGTFGWKIEGTCIIKGYERKVPIDDRMMATLTIRFSGAATEAAAAS